MTTRAWQMWIVLIAAGCGGSEEAAPNRALGSSGSGGIAGSLGAAGFGGTTTGAAGGGVAPTGSGAQLSRCTSDDDCGGGLGCYIFGRYCSRMCATDTDCSSLGGAYTCYVGGGGPMTGGGPMGAGSGGAGSAAPAPPTSSADGTCRLECSGEGDTSCPQGLMCIDVGFGMMATFRCGYPSTMGGGPGGGSGGTSGGSGGRGPGGGSGGGSSGASGFGSSGTGGSGTGGSGTGGGGTGGGTAGAAGMAGGGSGGS